MSSCTQCGADGCRAAFDELLAYEFTHPAAFGPVHHLTVASYSLQHPTGYTEQVLRHWRTLIADVLDGRATTAELRARERAAFEGATRVREPSAEPPAGWPRQWPVCAPGALPAPGETTTDDGHVERVRRWAASVRETLGDR